jgi:hypothetical protein
VSGVRLVVKTRFAAPPPPHDDDDDDDDVYK